MNYFAKTVYSVATKTCPLAVHRRFSQAKSEGAKMHTFEKCMGGMAPWPPGSAATAYSLKIQYFEQIFFFNFHSKQLSESITKQNRPTIRRRICKKS